MSIEHVTEYRVLFKGIGECHVTRSLADAADYVAKGVEAGNPVADYSIEHRRVTIHEWASTTMVEVGPLVDGVALVPGLAVRAGGDEPGPYHAFGRIARVDPATASITWVGSRGGAMTYPFDKLDDLRVLRTADGVPLREGLRVWDYNLDAGTVELARLNDEGWFHVRVGDDARSFMNAERVCVRHPHHGQSPPATYARAQRFGERVEQDDEHLLRSYMHGLKVGELRTLADGMRYRSQSNKGEIMSWLLTYNRPAVRQHREAARRAQA